VIRWHRRFPAETWNWIDLDLKLDWLLCGLESTKMALLKAIEDIISKSSKLPKEVTGRCTGLFGDLRTTATQAGRHERDNDAFGILNDC
jgi:hypothetical protein